ncbi:MAG: hypothetical protein HY226_04890 [Candidatus Vogelbacteria bacterium]|nr:hypothetical protein [Candidatus Vogelbacteria bacterium]
MKKRVPFWIEKFESTVRNLRRLSGNKWYKHPQPSLSTLKRTGRGNCVAWSKLMSEIAVHANLTVILLIIGERYESKSKELPHQICVIVDREKNVWIQSNIWCTKYKKLRLPLTKKRLKRLLKRIATRNGKKCDYKTGTKIYSTIIVGEI